MRNNKNNITLSSQNIILFLKILIGHLTDNKKIITLCSIILTLSLLNITSTSALNYSNNINLNFTINPSLSLSISSSDLVIDDLTPGTTADSNDIIISIVTNAAYGYTLSANASSEDLVHSNNINTFSSIVTNANLSNLTTDNTWGYGTKLSSDSTWSNYNGLSSSVSNTLLDANSNNTLNNGMDNIGFRIAAKASSTQPSGIYTNTITFYATTKPTPMNLAESYFANGKNRYKGYYTMQDMNSTICEETEVIGEGSQTQLIDIRDDKVYWATKLADGHCWMTQNLDLDIDSNRTYTHWDTDLGWSTENGNSIDESASWKPSASTRNSGWAYPANTPVSLNPGDKYIYTSNSEEKDTEYSSFSDCVAATNDNTDCSHSHLGNYYNWPASIANNDTSSITTRYDAPNSICPASWKLPNITNNEYGNLLYNQNITTGVNSQYYKTNGFINIRKAPLYFVRGGNATGSLGILGRYYTGSLAYTIYPYYFSLVTTQIGYNYGNQSYNGYSARCLAR